MYPQETYMRRAIKLAQKGAGRVNPNPMVGAVVVKTDRSSAKASISNTAVSTPKKRTGRLP